MSKSIILKEDLKAATFDVFTLVIYLTILISIVVGIDCICFNEIKCEIDSILFVFIGGTAAIVLNPIAWALCIAKAVIKRRYFKK